MAKKKERTEEDRARARAFWGAVEKAGGAVKDTEMAKALQVPYMTYRNWRDYDRMPPADLAVRMARVLGVTVEFLATGEDVTVRNSVGEPVRISGSEEFVLIPVLEQMVSAGTGQELVSEALRGTVPFLSKMLAGHDLKQIRAVEVKGDSMTGIQLFNGDCVIFALGETNGDGIYVIRIGNAVLVKRIEFDYLHKKIIIMSENARYPEHRESMESEDIEIMGKVLGWIHKHPY
jgi:phage repressor protein C with HTH and peptisase S24 domain